MRSSSSRPSIGSSGGRKRRASTDSRSHTRSSGTKTWAKSWPVVRAVDRAQPLDGLVGVGRALRPPGRRRCRRAGGAARRWSGRAPGDAATGRRPARRSRSDRAGRPGGRSGGWTRPGRRRRAGLELGGRRRCRCRRRAPVLRPLRPAGPSRGRRLRVASSTECGVPLVAFEQLEHVPGVGPGELVPRVHNLDYLVQGLHRYSRIQQMTIHQATLMHPRPTYDDANLILRLYEMRRDERMREARAWFTAKFKADRTRRNWRRSRPAAATRTLRTGWS